MRGSRARSRSSISARSAASRPRKPAFPRQKETSPTHGRPSRRRSRGRISRRRRRRPMSNPRRPMSSCPRPCWRRRSTRRPPGRAPASRSRAPRCSSPTTASAFSIPRTSAARPTSSCSAPSACGSIWTCASPIAGIHAGRRRDAPAGAGRSAPAARRSDRPAAPRAAGQAFRGRDQNGAPAFRFGIRRLRHDRHRTRKLDAHPHLRPLDQGADFRRWTTRCAARRIGVPVPPGAGADRGSQGTGGARRAPGARRAAIGRGPGQGGARGPGTGRTGIDAGAAALRCRRGDRHRSHRRADPPRARARQPDRRALSLQCRARRPGAGYREAAAMKKRIVPILVIVLAVVAGAIAYRNLHHGDPNRIVVSGNIELEEVNIAFKTAGRLIERAVDEGDTVRKGQVIARLDRDQLIAQQERETAGLQSSEYQLAQAETSLQWQKATLAADIEQKKADLAAAEARLAELKHGSRPQEIQDARAAVEAAQAEADRARKDYERGQTLIKNDDISAAQFDQYRDRADATAASLKSARERLDLVLAGPRIEQIEAQAAQVERSRALLKMTEANALELKRREQELATRRAEAARSKASLALIGTQISDTVADSPVDGVVLVKAADVGEILAPGTTVVTVGDIDHPWLRGYINETDLAKVKIGSLARVTTDSYPGKVYRGRVSFISSEAEFTPKQIQTQQERVKLVYRIKIEVENPNHELKSNMPADAEIVLGR